MPFEEDLTKWEKERPLYIDLTEFLNIALREIFDANRLPVTISIRLKDDISLMKKLIKKQRENSNYKFEEISDKCGARIICRVKDDVLVASKIIESCFDVQKTDNKYESYKYWEQGYKGIHKDVKLKNIDEKTEKFKDLIFEIQIRTLCDNVWADIYHDIGYKPENIVDNQVNRQLHCLAGLLEVGDNEISQINNNIKNSKKMTPEFILSCIEGPFIELFRIRYDPSYSIENLKFFNDLLAINSTESFKTTIADFINKNKRKIIHIRKEREDELILNPLSTQPEVFIIWYLAEKDPYLLTSRWNEKFPSKYLEELTNWWSKTLTTKV